MTNRTPSAFTRKARSGSDSHASTAVMAAQCTIASGWVAPIAPSTASRSPTSSAARSRPMTSCGCSASTTSRPTMPPAPVTRTRNARSLPRGGLVDRRPLQQRFPPVAILRIPLDGLAQARLEADLRFPTELGPDLRGVEQVSPIVPGAVGNDGLQRVGLAERGEHRVGDVLD